MILRVDPHSGIVTKIASKGIGSTSSMVFDEGSNQLIFTDSLHRTMQSLNATTTNRTLLYNFPDNSVPWAISAAQKKQKLFVAVNKSPVQVMQLSMDGKQRSYLKLNWTLDSPDANVTLTIDDKNSMLYASLGQRIMAFNYDKGVESKFGNNLSTKANHMMLRVESGEFIYTGSDGIIHWNDKFISLNAFGKDFKTDTSAPIIAYKTRVSLPSTTHRTIIGIILVGILITMILVCVILLVMCLCKKKLACKPGRIDRDSQLTFSNHPYEGNEEY